MYGRSKKQTKDIKIRETCDYESKDSILHLKSDEELEVRKNM